MTAKSRAAPHWAVRSLILIVLVGVAMMAPRAGQHPRLSFAERVRAQEAIERVFHAHLIGGSEPFDLAMPKGVLEQKVRTYLRQSVALEHHWNAPISAEALDRELQRIAESTRLPDRLAEVYRALGNDPMLVLECYVRPILADRLTREFLASDSRAGLGAWDDWWRTFGRDLERLAPSIPEPRTMTLPIPKEKATRPFDPAQCDPGGAWAAGPAAQVPGARAYHVAVWTGSHMFVWGVENTGSLYDPLSDSWARISGINAPVFDFETDAVAAVWTGSRVLLWGLAVGSPVGTGGRYDPVQDTWTPISSSGAPENRGNHRAVWTGSEMIVWGGTRRSDGNEVNTGGRYNPASDTWTPTTLLNAPGPREVHSAVWTGSAMIVWGGRADNTGQDRLDTGGQYDPVHDTWTSTSLVGAPSPRAFHTAAWTGTQMLVWGGDSFDFTNTGARYNPVLDQWTPMTDLNAPQARIDHVHVWTGNRLVVWGGYGGEATLFNSGGSYNPANDTWTSLAPVPTEARRGTTAVWTGTRMIIWGGYGEEILNTGGRYDPTGGTWEPTAISVAPGGRAGHTAVWTGNLMIVWAGVTDGSGYFSDGGLYDPLVDSWRPTSLLNAPSPREGHTAVWTGSRMIVWGGYSAEPPTYTPDFKNSGAAYNPITDTWQATSSVNAPPGSIRHTAVWVGNRMIVFGGVNSDGPVSGAGAGRRYDPATNTWENVSTVNMPDGRFGHTAVSTGVGMIVWGGSTPGGITDTGARYDPAQDLWVPLAQAGAPTARSEHSAVWTGDRMIVWGGSDGTALNTGAVYDLAADSWTPMTAVNAPSPRMTWGAVWTGDRMVIWSGADPETSNPPLATGGQYFPGTNTWIPTVATGAPGERFGQTQVWTGRSVLGWAGASISYYSDGYEYFPGGLQDEDADGWVCVADCDDHLNVVHPGAFEFCDGLDNDCDGAVDEPDSDADGIGDCVDNCIDVVNAGQEDSDGDGTGNVCDCAPSDGGVSAAPVQTSLFFLNQATLTWPPVGSATLRSIVRGKLEELPVGAGPSEACLVSNTSSAAVVDPSLPPLNRGFWYLMRAENACGTASYGQASNGTPRFIQACP